MFVSDYPKVHFLKQGVEGIQDDYFNTSSGHLLNNKLTKALTDAGYRPDEVKVTYKMDYAYLQVPRIARTNFRDPSKNTYIPPTNKEVTPFFDGLRERTVTFDPDIIIPFGGLGCKAYLGANKITALRGKPEQVDVLGHNYWVLPTFSMDYMSVSPNNVRLVETDLRLLAKFITNGVSTFIPVEVAYQSFKNDDFEGVVNAFNEALTHGKTPLDPITWDYETNSTRGEYDKAKLLSLSISVGAKSGFTFPLEHHEYPWEPEQLKVLKGMVAELLSSDRYKVAHNTAFDIRQSKQHIAKGLTTQRCMDTMVAYYLSVSQETQESFGLKTLAFQYTDMGGYEQRLDDYKKWFPTFYKAVDKLFKVEKKEDPEYYQTLTLERLEATIKDRVEPELYFSGLDEHDLDVVRYWTAHLLQTYLKAADITNEANPDDKFSYEWIPYSMLSQYASGDVDCARRIHEAIYQQEILKNPKWTNLYIKHYPELMDALTDIEVTGMQVDRDRLLYMANAFEVEQERLMKEILIQPEALAVQRYKEDQFEIGLAEKAKPVAERDKDVYRLYNKYRKEEDRLFKPSTSHDAQLALINQNGYFPPAEKIYLTKKTSEAIRNRVLKESELNWSHYSVGAETMAWFEETYPKFELARLIAQYKKLGKLISTYTMGILDTVDSNDVLHGSIKATGTETSRLASAKPNLQNFPRHVGNPSKFDYAYPIKTYFVPLRELGHDTLLMADYSAQEMRLTAVVADDESMIKAFLEGEDVHKNTAALAFGVPVDEVTSDMRSRAKAVSFRLLYGETPESYSGKNEMSLTDAQDLFDRYYKGKPKVKQLLDNSKETARKEGYIEVPGSGFRRKLNNIWSTDRSKVQSAERQATNTIIQGGSAWITQNAIIMINNTFRKFNLNAKLIVTVHDSVVASTTHELAPMIGKIMKTAMENLPLDFLNVTYNGKIIKFPMEAELGIGINYNDEVELDLDDFATFKSTYGYCTYYHELEDIQNHQDVHVKGLTKLLGSEDSDSPILRETYAQAFSAEKGFVQGIDNPDDLAVYYTGQLEALKGRKAEYQLKGGE